MGLFSLQRQGRKLSRNILLRETKEGLLIGCGVVLADPKEDLTKWGPLLIWVSSGSMGNSVVGYFS